MIELKGWLYYNDTYDLDLPGRVIKEIVDMEMQDYVMMWSFHWNHYLPNCLKAMQ